jgi:tetratricopeptide (TPR) repeat protein
VGTLNGLGGLVFDLGEDARAVPILLEAVAAAKDMGDKHAAARALSNLALARHGIAELSRAHEAAEESVRLYREVRDHYDIAWALDSFGLIELAEGRPDEARKLFEEALSVREDNGLIGGQSRQNLALAMARQGHHHEAIRACQRPVDELHDQGLVGAEVEALSVLADLQLEAGEVASARASVDRALSLGDEGKRRATARTLGPMLAAVEFAEGDRTAPDRLERALEAREMTEDMRRWARLLLGKLRVQSGKRARCRAILTELVAETRRSGQRDVLIEAEIFLGKNP